jgi:hypothetical protein
MIKKTTFGFATVLAISLLAAGGCGRKATQGARPARVQMFGVYLDTPRLDTDFTNASPEVQESVQAVKNAIRRGQIPAAMVRLEQLASNASLSEAQKKLASDLRDKLGQVLAKGHPAPAAP